MTAAALLLTQALPVALAEESLVPGQGVNLGQQVGAPGQTVEGVGEGLAEQKEAVENAQTRFDGNAGVKAAVTPEATDEELIQADVNGDGEINIVDLITAAQSGKADKTDLDRIASLFGKSSKEAKERRLQASQPVFTQTPPQEILAINGVPLFPIAWESSADHFLVTTYFDGVPTFFPWPVDRKNYSVYAPDDGDYKFVVTPVVNGRRGPSAEFHFRVDTRPRETANTEAAERVIRDRITSDLPQYAFQMISDLLTARDDLKQEIQANPDVFHKDSLLSEVDRVFQAAYRFNKDIVYLSINGLDNPVMSKEKADSGRQKVETMVTDYLLPEDVEAGYGRIKEKYGQFLEGRLEKAKEFGERLAERVRTEFKRTATFEELKASRDRMFTDVDNEIYLDLEQKEKIKTSINTLLNIFAGDIPLAAAPVTWQTDQIGQGKLVLQWAPDELVDSGYVVTVKFQGVPVISNQPLPKSEFILNLSGNNPEQWIGDYTIEITASAKGKTPVSWSSSFSLAPNQIYRLQTPILEGIAETTIRDMSIAVRWQKIEGAASYEIEISGDPNFSNARSVKVDSAQKLEAVLKDLADEATYYVRIRAVSDKGWSRWSIPAQFRVSLLPGQVQGIEVPQKVNDTRVTVRWTPQTKAVGGYIVIAQGSDGSLVKATASSPQDSSVVLEGLKDKVVYHITIAAVGSGGIEGLKSPIWRTEVDLPAPLPGKVAGLTVPSGIVREPAAAISWQAEVNSVTYEIELDGKVEQNGNTNLRVAGSNYQLPNLTEGTHRVRVRGVNEDGVAGKEWSDIREIIIVLPPPKPGLVKGITVTSGQGTAEIRWEQEPLSDRYLLFIDGWQFATVYGVSTTLTLSNGSHSVQIRGENIEGLDGSYGEYGNPIEFFVELPPNHSPEFLLGVVTPQNMAENSFLTFDFSARDIDGDSLTYSIVMSDGSTVPGWISVGNTGKLNLEPGFANGRNAPYQFWVKVSDGKGGDRLSSQVVVTVADVPVEEPAVLPEKITGVTGEGTITQTNVQINWSAAANAASYRITINGNDNSTRTETSSATSFNVTNLADGVTYTIAVVGVNADGVAGEASNPISVLVDLPALIPVKVTGVTGEGTITQTNVQINWSAATNAASYRITINGGDNSTRTEPSATNSFNVTNLADGVTYTISVAGVNADGVAGEASNLVTVLVDLPAGLPAKVTGVTGQGTITQTSVQINWSAAANAASYRVTISGSDNSTRTEPSATNSFNVTNLTDGVTYTITVAGVNADGVAGEVSNPVTVLVDLPAGIPVKVTGVTGEGTITQTSVQINWSAAANAASYRITINGSDNSTRTEPSATNSFNVTNLADGVTYTISVAGVNADGVAGEVSSPIMMLVDLPSGNQPPVAMNGTNAKVNAGQATGVAINLKTVAGISDPDTTDTLTITPSNPLPGWASLSGEILTVTNIPVDAGSQVLTFKVSDGALEKEFTVTIPVNRGPVMTETYVVSSVKEGGVVSFTLMGSDPDGDALTYSLVGAPEGMTIDTASGEIRWETQVGNKGNYAFKVKAADGDPAHSLFKETEVQLTVSAKSTTPQLPGKEVDRIIMPAAQVIGKEVTIQWEADADSYEVTIIQGSNQIAWSGKITGNNWKVRLENDDQYRVEIVAYRNGFSPSKLVAAEFELKVPPVAPSEVTYEVASNIAGLLIVFWANDRSQGGADDSFEISLKDNGQVIETGHQALYQLTNDGRHYFPFRTRIQEGKNYEVEIKAINRNGTTASSLITVTRKPPEPPAIPAKINKVIAEALGLERKIIINWQGDANATKGYRVKIERTEGGGAYETTVGAGETSVTFSDLKFSGLYNVSVIGLYKGVTVEIEDGSSNEPVEVELKIPGSIPGEIVGVQINQKAGEEAMGVTWTADPASVKYEIFVDGSKTPMIVKDATSQDMALAVGKHSLKIRGVSVEGIIGSANVGYSFEVKKVEVVLPGNHAPVFSGVIGNQEMKEGTAISPINVSSYFSDEDIVEGGSDQLTYSVVGALPAGLSLDIHSGEIVGTAEYMTQGEYKIKIKAKDNAGIEVTGNEFTIVVANTNRPPEGGKVIDLTVSEGETLSFIIPEATDPDGQELIYELLDEVEGVGFNPQTRTLTWIPGPTQSGEYDIGIVAIDNDPENPRGVLYLIFITVTDEITFEFTVPLPQTLEIEEGKTWTFEVSATNWNGEPITAYRLENAQQTLPGGPVVPGGGPLPQGLGIDESTGIISWMPGFDQAGSYHLVVVTEDNTGVGGIMWDDFSITVVNVNTNQPPVASDGTSAKVNAGQEAGVAINLTAVAGISDSDTTDTLTITQINPLPAWASLSGEILKVTNIPVDAGSQVLTFKVSDGALEKEFTVTIPVNRGPSASNYSEPNKVNEGTSYTKDLKPLVSDADNDALTITTVGALPVGAVLTNGVLSWTNVLGNAGSQVLTFKVSDGALEKEFTVTIPVNPSAFVLQIGVTLPESIAVQTIADSSSSWFSITSGDQIQWGVIDSNRTIFFLGNALASDSVLSEVAKAVDRIHSASEATKKEGLTLLRNLSFQNSFSDSLLKSSVEAIVRFTSTEIVFDSNVEEVAQLPSNDILASSLTRKIQQAPIQELLANWLMSSDVTQEKYWLSALLLGDLLEKGQLSVSLQKSIGDFALSAVPQVIGDGNQVGQDPEGAVTTLARVITILSRNTALEALYLNTLLEGVINVFRIQNEVQRDIWQDFRVLVVDESDVLNFSDTDYEAFWQVLDGLSILTGKTRQKIIDQIKVISLGKLEEEGGICGVPLAGVFDDHFLTGTVFFFNTADKMLEENPAMLNSDAQGLQEFALAHELMHLYHFYGMGSLNREKISQLFNQTSVADQLRSALTMLTGDQEPLPVKCINELFSEEEVVASAFALFMLNSGVIEVAKAENHFALLELYLIFIDEFSFTEAGREKSWFFGTSAFTGAVRSEKGNIKRESGRIVEIEVPIFSAGGLYQGINFKYQINWSGNRIVSVIRLFPPE